MNGARLLIAVGAAAEDLAEIPAGVQLLIDAAEEIMVIAPALPSRWEWLASDTDKTVEKADERLAAVLGQLDGAAVARAEIGADDPLLAFSDAAREFRPDHILIGMREPDQADWQERGLVDQLLRTFSIPLTVFQVSAGTDSVA
jgi:hypothetical protein